MEIRWVCDGNGQSYGRSNRIVPDMGRTCEPLFVPIGLWDSCPLPNGLVYCDDLLEGIAFQSCLRADRSGMEGP